jgi:membrane-bound metal-dependent hydrolase YbcI (DUF457 family)
VTLANAPDLDLLPGLAIGSPQLFHRGVTHTLVAAVVVGLLGWLGARRRGAAPGMVGRLAGLAALAWTSHVFVDFVTANAEAPHGVPLFWPFVGGYWIAPRPLLAEVTGLDRLGSGAFLRGVVDPAAGRVWLEETGVLITAVAAVHAVRLGRALLRVRTADVA